MFDSFKKMFSSGDEGGEKGELEKKLKSNPNDAQTRQRLALILLRDRQVREGLAHLAKVAEGYENAGFDSKAVAVWRQYLKYDADNLDANRKLVAVLARQGLAGDARNEFTKAAPRLRTKLGDDAFVDFCRTVAKVLPGSAVPDLLACEVLLARGNVLEVLSTLTATVETALAAHGEKEPFAAVLARFAAVCGNRTDHSAETAFLWLRLGEPERALPHFEKALMALRASGDAAATATAERVIRAVREGKDPGGKGVFSFADAAIALDAFFPEGEGIDIVVEGGAAPAAPAVETPAAPAAAPPPPPPPAAPPQATLEAMAEEDQGIVRAAFGKLHARVEEEIGESDLEARYNLGIAYKEMGLLDEAAQEFTTARKRRDLAFSCAVHLAEIQAAKGDFDASLAELDDLIGSSTPGSMELFDLRYQKADVLEAAGRDAEAGEIFRALLKENPNYRDVRSRAERYRS